VGLSGPRHPHYFEACPRMRSAVTTESDGDRHNQRLKRIIRSPGESTDMFREINIEGFEVFDFAAGIID
jgi:hypothetical protein